MMIIAVGSGERIARVLPELGGLLRRPLITLERVRVCKRDGELLARPHELPGTDEHGLALWQKLMVYTSEAARRTTASRCTARIVRRLRDAGARRRDHAARDLGLPRRPRPARRPAASAAAATSRS